MIQTYNIDDDTAFSDFMDYLREEKPEKTFNGDLIELPEFNVRIFPAYRKKLYKALNIEREDGYKHEFDVSEYKTEVIENHGYKFVTFGG